MFGLAEHRAPQLPVLGNSCLEHCALHFQVRVVLLLVYLLGICMVFRTWDDELDAKLQTFIKEMMKSLSLF